MMKSMGHRASAAEVAKLYQDFVSVFVLDAIDDKHAAQVKALDMRPVVTRTIMHGLREKTSLARVVARELGIKA
jgi:LPPG:FO 2-phospho-L-lactate transferase